MSTFNIKDIIGPADLMAIATGKKKPLDLLNGPFGEKISKGFASFLKSQELKENEHSITAMIHEKEGETFITIIALEYAEKGFKTGRVISEQPLKNLGQLIEQLMAKQPVKQIN